MITLTQPNATEQQSSVEQVNLSSRIPLSDPGGWFTVLYGQLPAADLRLADPSDKRLNSRIVKATNENSLKFLLIDLDLHPWLAHEPAGLGELVKDAKAYGLRIVPYSHDRLPTVETCESREAAIEACLGDWEKQLLQRFCW